MKTSFFSRDKVTSLASLKVLFNTSFYVNSHFRQRVMSIKILFLLIITLTISTTSCNLRNGFDIVWDGGYIVKCNGRKNMVETFNINVTPRNAYQSKKEYIEKNKTSIKIKYNSKDEDNSYLKVYPPDGKVVTFSHLRNTTEVNSLRIRDDQFFLANDEGKDGLEYTIKLELDELNHIAACYVGRRLVLGYWMERFSIVDEKNTKLNKFD